MSKQVYVTAAQIAAAKAIIEISERTGREVQPEVYKIAAARSSSTAGVTASVNDPRPAPAASATAAARASVGS